MRKKIDLEDSPRRVDNILQKNYSLSLYYFAVSLVDVFFAPDFRSLNIAEYNYQDLPWRDFWLKRVKELEKLREYNKNTWSEIVFKTDPFLNPYQKNVSQIGEKIKKLSKLISDLIENINEDYLSFSKVRGAPYKQLNILFLVWSHFIKENNIVHIQTLLDLLRWFSIRAKCSFHDELITIYFKKEDVEDDNLSKVLYRYRSGELKSPREKVDRYKKRFLIPVTQHWLKKILNEKAKLNTSIIIFSNGERLTAKDYIENNLSYYSIPLKEKANCPSQICLDYKSLNPEDDSWLWQIELVKYIDNME